MYGTRCNFSVRSAAVYYIANVSSEAVDGSRLVPVEVTLQ
jgi:hypothetical protein